MSVVSSWKPQIGAPAWNTRDSIWVLVSDILDAEEGSNRRIFDVVSATGSSFLCHEAELSERPDGIMAPQSKAGEAPELFTQAIEALTECALVLAGETMTVMSLEKALTKARDVLKRAKGAQNASRRT